MHSYRLLTLSYCQDPLKDPTILFFTLYKLILLCISSGFSHIHNFFKMTMSRPMQKESIPHCHSPPTYNKNETNTTLSPKSIAVIQQ